MLNGLIMKKIASIILLLTSIAYAQTEASYKLSPELDEFMTLQSIPEQYFEHNAYIGWMGLTYPKDDWLTIYRDIFQINDDVLNQKINNGRLLTNYFANPRQAIFQTDNNQEILKDLFGHDDGLMDLYVSVDPQSFLHFKQGALDNKRYRYTRDFFVCADYVSNDCLAQMKERREYILTTIQDNQLLLNRFKELVESSQYNYALFYNDLNASLETVPSSGMIKLIQLYLTDAIMKISEGEVNEGLDQLVIVRQWIDLMFHEKSKASLLHFFVNISVTQLLDQTINVLLDEQLLNNALDDPKLIFIVRPYPENIGRKLNEVVLFEMKQNFKDFAYGYIKIYHSSQDNVTLSEEDEYIVLSYLKNFGVILSPVLDNLYQIRAATAKHAKWDKVRNLQKSTQSIDKIWFNVVHQAQDLRPYTADEEGELELLHRSHEYFLQVLNDWYSAYFQSIGMTPKDALFYLNDLYPSTYFYNQYFKMIEIISLEENLNQHLSVRKLDELLKNSIDADTLKFAQSLTVYSNFDNYWVRLYEQQNYHQLVYLKYLIMSGKISEDNIPEFLDGMKDLARNTITKKQYNYDAETGKLSTPLPRQNKHLPAHIKISRLYDSSIQNFEVILPQY